MTLEKWIERYNKKAPEPFVHNPQYELYFREDKGFCEVGMSEDMMFIHALCGDARWWKEQVENAGRAVGISKAGTICIRDNIRAYIRLFGGVIKEEMRLEDGRVQFVAYDKATGIEGRFSPAFTYKDSGIQAYYVTWGF